MTEAFEDGEERSLSERAANFVSQMSSYSGAQAIEDGATFVSFTESPYQIRTLEALADGVTSILRGTVGRVDHGTYFTVVDGELVGLEASTSLPAGFAAILPSRVESLLEQAIVTIGAWSSNPDRPHVLALDSTGALISVIAVDPQTVDALPALVDRVDRWLSTLRLRDLSDLSGDPVSFYEGLLDLSPDATMSLSSQRRTVLITAVETIDLGGWPESLDSSAVEIQYFDVLAAPGGGAPILTRRASTAADITTEAAVSPLADVIDLTSSDHHVHELSEPTPDAVSGDETTMQPLPGPPAPPIPATIDLTDAPPSRVSPIDASVLRPAPQIRPGATFPIDRLPLLFDPLGANLTSISDELFAVDQHLVLVEKLPEKRRDIPFEDRNRFRWAASEGDIELLETHGTAPDGHQRVLHLFAETQQQGPYCVYIGELTRIESRARSSHHAAWFSISPTINDDLYRLLKKGRLPEHVESPTVDFGTLDA